MLQKASGRRRRPGKGRVGQVIPARTHAPHQHPQVVFRILCNCPEVTGALLKLRQCRWARSCASCRAGQEKKRAMKSKRQCIEEGTARSLSPAAFVGLRGHCTISCGAKESGLGRQRRRPRMAAALPSSVCMCLSGPTRFMAGLCYSRGDRALEQSMLTGLGLQDLDREA